MTIKPNTMQLTKEPTMSETIETGIEVALSDIHTCMPGVIQTYYPLTQTVDVKLANKQVFESYSSGDPVTEEYPTLLGIPVCFPSGGGINMTFPLAPGDNVIVYFSESDINNFRSNGIPSNEPGLLTRFSLSGGMAIPCNVANKTYTGVANPLTNNAVVINAGGQSDFVALAAKVESNFNDIKTLINTKSAVNGSPLDVAFWPTGVPDVAATKLKSE